MNSNADVQANEGERAKKKQEGDDKTKTRCIARCLGHPPHIMTHKIHRRLRNDQQTLQGVTNRRKRPQLDLWVN